MKRVLSIVLTLIMLIGVMGVSALADAESSELTIIVTGGTGTAWLPHLKERYQRMETLEIVCANQNEAISPIYSNVRGYYIFRALSGGGR